MHKHQNPRGDIHKYFPYTFNAKTEEKKKKDKG